MQLTLFQADAFTDHVFGGNPAAVCPLDTWLPDALMQAIAAENNLAETAFFVPEGDGYRLRWFTPTLEIDLCGHATLATAHIIWQHLGYVGDEIRFYTRSGCLPVTRRAAGYTLDFPSRPPVAVVPSDDLLQAIGQQPVWAGRSRDYLVLLDSEAAVRALRPDLVAVARLDAIGLIVTAPGEQVDFVSRFFGPQAGVPEDPVTGSAHSTLIPFWAERLGKTQLEAWQVSQRGGVLHCELIGDRVRMTGQAVTYMKADIFIPFS
jgi:PhzF family phenazine biosynthesis protein